jgi:hypothetical protein
MRVECCKWGVIGLSCDRNIEIAIDDYTEDSI